MINYATCYFVIN